MVSNVATRHPAMLATLAAHSEKLLFDEHLLIFALYAAPSVCTNSLSPGRGLGCRASSTADALALTRAARGLSPGRGGHRRPQGIPRSLP